MYIFFICAWGSFAPAFLKKNLNYCETDSYGFTLTRLKEVKQIKDVDILFLGSSRSYRSFDVRIFNKAGFTTFNLGSSAQTPLQTEVLLKRYLANLNPRTIIYEVDPEIFVSDGIESSIDIIANDRNDINSFNMALKQNNIKVYNSLIYALFKEKLLKKEDYKENIKNKEDTYISNGFVQKDICSFTTIKYETNNKLDVTNKQFIYFENIVKLIQKNNIKLILIQSPITNSLYQTYSNNFIFAKTMQKYGEYYDFNGLPELDDSLHFYDNVHLNQKGVEIFNKIIIEILFGKNHSTQKIVGDNVF